MNAPNSAVTRNYSWKPQKPSTHVHSSSVPSSSQCNLNLIIVPDVGCNLTQASSVLALFQKVAPQASSVCFEWNLRIHNGSAWDALATLGDALADLLKTEVEKQQRNDTSIIVVSYGLGGLILKRAVNKAFSSLSHVLVLDALKALVFFSVPHPSYRHRERWPKLLVLLRILTALDKKRLLNAEQHSAAVADEAQKFEGACVDLKTVTIYETKPTKISRRGWWSSKSVLVGRSFSEIMMSSQTFPNETDYHGVGKFTDDSLIAKSISNVIEEVLVDLSTQTSQDDAEAEIIPPTSLLRDMAIRSRRQRWASTESDFDCPSLLGEATPDLVTAENSDFSSYEKVNDLMMSDKVPTMPCYFRRSFAHNPNFVGRRDIMEQIDKVLLPSSKDPAGDGLRTFSICGYGGLGKTQTAVQYSFEKENCFDAIFMIQADSTNKISTSFEAIAQALGFIDQKGDADRAVSRRLVMEWLLDPKKAAPGEEGQSSSHNSLPATWLLIFDNVDDLKVLDDYWSSILEAPNGSILVTSRDPMAKSDLTFHHGIDMPPMSMEDCTMLLQKLSPQGEDANSEHFARKLAERIGGIPLAVSQIAALIQRQRMTTEEFLAEYGEGSFLHELAALEGLSHRDQYKKTLSTVWNFEKFQPAALTLINLLTFLDPDEIAEYILTQNVVVDRIENYPEPGKDFITARTEILSTSLIKRELGRKTLSLHRLVQEVGREKLSIETARLYYAFAIRLLYSAWKFQDDRFNRESYERDEAAYVLPHVLVIHRSYDELGGDYLSVEQRRQFVNLLSESAWYLVQRAEYDPAGPIFDLCLSVCEQYKAELEDLLADTLFAYARYGEEINMDPNRVHDFCRRYNELCIARNDGSRPRREDLATSHTSLAQGQLLLDQWENAIKNCKKCIELDYETIPEIRSGQELNQFAYIFQAWGLYGLGKYEEAQTWLRKVVTFRQGRFGPDDTQSPKLGFALHLLGMVSGKLASEKERLSLEKEKLGLQQERLKLEKEKTGLESESLQCYIKALENFKVTIGISSFRIGQVCLKLAEHHARASQPEAAAEYFYQTRKVFELQVYYKPELARAYYKESCFHESLGVATDAATLDLQLITKAETLYREVVPEHPLDKEISAEDYDKAVRFWSR